MHRKRLSGERSEHVTLASYEAAAEVYADRTLRTRPELESFMARLVAMIPGGRILEVGSGPGWDAKYLESLGAHVERSDATKAFVEMMRADGYSARRLNILTDNFGGHYDAIFANAVLLHLTREQFEAVLQDARVTAPLFAFTLKEGSGDEWSTEKIGLPRYFTYWREPAVREVIESAGWPMVSIERVGEGGAQPWLFVVAARNPRPKPKPRGGGRS